MDEIDVRVFACAQRKGGYREIKLTSNLCCALCGDGASSCIIFRISRISRAPNLYHRRCHSAGEVATTRITARILFAATANRTACLLYYYSRAISRLLYMRRNTHHARLRGGTHYFMPGLCPACATFPRCACQSSTFPLFFWPLFTSCQRHIS